MNLALGVFYSFLAGYAFGRRHDLLALIDVGVAALSLYAYYANTRRRS